MERPQNGLTVALIKSLRLAPKGQSYDVGDAGETRRLLIRVSSVSKTFYMSARWGKGKASSTLRVIGLFTAISSTGYVTLAQARATTRKWDKRRKAGIDPKRPAEDATFAALLEKYLGRIKFKEQKQAAKYEREIRRELADKERNPWLNRAVSDIEDVDIALLVAAIRDRPAPGQALNVLGHIRTIFNHAMMPEHRRTYGLTVNPIAHLNAASFDLEKKKRHVILFDLQLAVFWAATEGMGYPFGPYYQELCLGGQRISNWQTTRRSQFDLAKREFKIPATEFKTGVDHIVRLSDKMIEILQRLPCFNDPEWGEYLFSFTNGQTAMNCRSQAKRELDAAMLAELKKKAVSEGADANAVVLEPFVNHDFRRVIRTQLEGLKVPRPVSEAVIGHGKRGIEATYNLYEYYEEKLEALQAWAVKLEQIVKENWHW